MSALANQIDGNHYKNQPIQPIELAYYLKETPCFCKLAKYLTRDKGDKKINLQKAVHCIKLEQELSGFAEGYDNIFDIKIVKYWLNKFSSNQNITEALFLMNQSCYHDAIEQVELYAKSLGINLKEQQ